MSPPPPNRWCCCWRRWRCTSPRSCGPDSGTRTPWPPSPPEADPQWLVDETVEIPVQLNGKVRARIRVPADADEAAMEAAARASAQVAELLAANGAVVRKVVIVPGRLINFVVG